jgi:hypothetical protein
LGDFLKLAGHPQPPGRKYPALLFQRAKKVNGKGTNVAFLQANINWLDSGNRQVDPKNIDAVE